MLKKQNSYFNKKLNVKILFTEPLILTELKLKDKNIIKQDSYDGPRDLHLNLHSDGNVINAKTNYNRVYVNNDSKNYDSINTNNDTSDEADVDTSDSSVGGYEQQEYNILIKNKDIRLRFLNYIYSICKYGIIITRNILLNKKIDMNSIRKYAEFEFSNMKMDREAVDVLKLDKNCNILQFPFQDSRNDEIISTIKSITKGLKKNNCLVIKEYDNNNDPIFLAFWKNFYEELLNKKIYYNNKTDIETEMKKNRFKLESIYSPNYNFIDNPGYILYMKFIKY